jgi:hypothetical protein
MVWYGIKYYLFLNVHGISANLLGENINAINKNTEAGV